MIGIAANNTEGIAGKNALVFGVANQESIAYYIAGTLQRQGARLAFGYYPGAKEYALPAIAKFRNSFAFECDATDEESLQRALSKVKKRWRSVDFIVHSIAFAHKKDLEGTVLDTPKDRFNLAVDTSAHSLIGITRTFLPLMKPGGSILTMTFQGGERVFPQYKVMGVCKATLEAIVKYLAFELGEKGIRVNAVSAGPVKTAAAAALKDFDKMLKLWAEASPLGKPIEKEDIGEAAAFLLGERAKSITGQVLHVDSGYSIMGQSSKKRKRLFG